MEIEKTLSVAAPPARVWDLLLDPQAMGRCVPGMKSIEVISPTEYVALMHVKISFISAKFKLRTNIVEQRAPEYLRAEGTGEDASVASSLKQRSEIFLAPGSNGGTDLRLKVTVDVLGRLGTFGLGVMKTKADRMWEEFGANLRDKIESASTTPPGAPSTTTATEALDSAHDPITPGAPATPPAKATEATAAPFASAPAPSAHGGSQGWWTRLLGARSNGVRATSDARTIRVEVRDPERTITVEWPVESADQCRSWLDDLVRQRQR
ncbi:SRPBCC family protein [Variovorax dokdonensis]|uniref:SRPBCC family protein n=1 Tax=Variovorax dokdonensis TaxID=344883 RepID=A0ABT7NCX7_9BURK|nr:SRPBCC family protein [Variovorax dokdonensis]MDM0045783.1 SRPBCC family protein [Variovorax dokdonensis]